jgi:apolipoprotein D and lipocalin family protein
MKKRVITFFLLTIFGFVFMPSAMSNDTLSTAKPETTGYTLTAAETLDLQRYMGRWYVIANIPYFPERGKVATYDEYRLREDGSIDNIYGFKKAFDKKETQWKALAKVVPNSGNRKWKVRFFGIINAELEVLEVAEDYSWAIIGHPKKEMGWLFSREQQMGDEQYAALIRKFENYGYQTAAFQRVPQFVEQKGKPGFQ